MVSNRLPFSASMKPLNAKIFGYNIYNIFGKVYMYEVKHHSDVKDTFES